MNNFKLKVNIFFQRISMNHLEQNIILNYFAFITLKLHNTYYKSMTQTTP